MQLLTVECVPIAIIQRGTTEAELSGYIRAGKANLAVCPESMLTEHTVIDG